VRLRRSPPRRWAGRNSQQQRIGEGQQVGGSLLARSPAARIGRATSAQRRPRDTTASSRSKARGDLTAHSVSSSISFRGRVFGAVESQRPAAASLRRRRRARSSWTRRRRWLDRSDLHPAETGPPPERHRQSSCAR
jgi:hypothetical protein